MHAIFVLLCFDVIKFACFNLDLCNLYTRIIQDWFIITGTIAWLPQYQWNNPENIDKVICITREPCA